MRAHPVHPPAYRPDGVLQIGASLSNLKQLYSFLLLSIFVLTFT